MDQNYNFHDASSETHKIISKITSRSLELRPHECQVPSKIKVVANYGGNLDLKAPRLEWLRLAILIDNKWSFEKLKSSEDWFNESRDSTN